MRPTFLDNQTLKGASGPEAPAPTSSACLGLVARADQAVLAFFGLPVKSQGTSYLVAQKPYKIFSTQPLCRSGQRAERITSPGGPLAEDYFQSDVNCTAGL